MKSFFGIVTAIICVIFGLTPFIPQLTLRMAFFGESGTLTLMWGFVIVSFLILVLCVCWMLSAYKMANAYRMVALTAGSVLALANAASVVIGINVKSPYLYKLVSAEPSYVLQGSMVLLFIFEVVYRKRNEFSAQTA